MTEKRVVHPALQQVLKADITITAVFCHSVEALFPPAKSRKYLKLLEVSCHGMPWLAVWLAFFWILWNPELFEMQVNFLVGLLLDMVFVTILKAAIRRRRPAGNKGDMFMVYGTDVYSFPSGHMSRAIFISIFFSKLYPASTFIQLFLFIWAIAVGVSRVLLKRHFILDITAGAALGFFEALVLGIIWMGPVTAKWLVSSISEEGVSLEGLQDATEEHGE